ncbi:MAG TPA: YeeE/YedE thiosulfate transporter family protein, partial [Symbiobacteriaceae bacterium]|nr:YeeE/YedE thiosulfate transporter family protein [Symbiobacteriaceae bacterium]
MLQTYVLPLTLGALFGLVLQKAGLSRYHKIVDVFRFKDMAVMKFMMTALCVAMVGVFLLKDMGLLQLKLKETYVLGNLLGGAIFGVGMALAGFCPGTCAAGIGQGSLDYLIPGLLGFLAGGLLFGATYQQVFVPIHAVGNYGAQTLATLWGVSPWLLIA